MTADSAAEGDADVARATRVQQTPTAASAPRTGAKRNAFDVLGRRGGAQAPKHARQAAAAPTEGPRKPASKPADIPAHLNAFSVLSAGANKQPTANCKPESKDASPAAAPRPAAAAKPAQASEGHNAFAVLQSNAARAFEAHTFFAGVVDGHWCVAIWRVGEPPPAHVPSSHRAWTATARISVPQSEPQGAKRSVELHLCTNVHPVATAAAAQRPDTAAGRRLQEALQQVPPPGAERYEGGVPLLKSAVQKAVRRGLVEETARLAHAFIEAAPADALRRAIVISVEDAALHPGVALAAWLMVAHGKGLALSLDHKAALLELYADLACCAVHDVGDGDAAEDAEPVDLAAVADTLPNSDARCGSLRALVSALVVRGAYGGMAGDVRLLRSAAQWWLTRLRHLPEPGARDSAAVHGPHANAVASSPMRPSSGGVLNVAQLPPGGQVGTSSEAAVMGSGGAAADASLSAQPSAMRWEALFQHEPHKFQGVLRLRRKDVPLAAVDHHIAQTVLTPLMSDEFVLEAALDLSSEVEQFSGDDPQSVLRKLLWIERSGVRNKRRVRWDAAAHAYCPAPDAAWPAHFGHPDAVRMRELVRRLHSIADAFATKYVRRAFAQ